MKDEWTFIALLFPPCNPSFVTHNKKFLSCSYVKMFPETRCIFLTPNIATYFITRRSNIKFRTSFWSSSPMRVMLMAWRWCHSSLPPAAGWPNRRLKVCYPPVRSPVQKIFISVLLHPKGNVDYFLDCLKLMKLQRFKENSVV